MTNRVQQLNDHLRDWRSGTLVPGARDGAIFVADWIRVLTGRDPAQGYRARYTSFRGGLRMVRRAGWTDIEALAAAYATPLRGWMQGLPGDVALVRQDGYLCFGIVGGGVIHVVSPRGGLDIVPLSAAERVYRP